METFDDFPPSPGSVHVPRQNLCHFPGAILSEMAQRATSLNQRKLFIVPFLGAYALHE
jgi:hypothetical protein